MTEKEFWSNVSAPNEDGCTIWMRYTDKDGYGQVYYDGAQDRSHRLAWRLTHGDIPAGICVLHKCDNPPCCNIDHLFLGTPRDNINDCVAKGRHPVGNANGMSILTRSQVVECHWLRKYGWRSIDIARMFGVDKRTIYDLLAGRTWRIVYESLPYSPNVEYKSHRLRGENHPYAKITERIVREMRLLYANGMKRSEIAKKYNVHWVCADSVVSRRQWKHIK